MNRLKTITIASVSIVALLSLGACSNPGIQAPQPGQGTGSANAEQPVATQSVGTIATTAPTGGAAVKIGESEAVVTKVACVEVNGVWAMSGSDENGGKTNVNTSLDKKTVEKASVIMADGTLINMDKATGEGKASISWDGDTFTVTGKGPTMNLNDPSKKGDEQEFVIKAACS